MHLLLLACAALAGTDFPYTPEALDLKLKREHTGLGYSPETSRERILEYVRSKRGGTGPLEQDEEKPDQLVLTDAKGKKWTAETDGGVVELRDPRGRIPLVFETKCKWFKHAERDRMQLSLEALIAAGAAPTYAYGGGHIQVQLKGWFEKHPVQFASLVNLALTYEPILMHLMTHQRRVEQTRPLFSTRRNDGTSLAQYLGTGLNRLLDDPAADCRSDRALARYYQAESRPGLSVRDNCLLAFIAHFGTEVVGDRTFAINLQSWRGAASPLKRHDSFELRLFNAARNAREAELEEQLVRVLADRAIRGPAFPYEEKVASYYDLDSFYQGYHPELREAHFRELLKEIGFDAGRVREYLAEYLEPAKHAARRSLPASAP